MLLWPVWNLFTILRLYMLLRLYLYTHDDLTPHTKLVECKKQNFIAQIISHIVVTVTTTIYTFSFLVYVTTVFQMLTL